MTRITRHSLRRPWLSVVLLATFLCHGLIPAGFMPGRGGLIVCPGYLPASGMAGMDMLGMSSSIPARHTGNGPHSPGHAAFGICPFAAAVALLAMVPAAPTVVMVEQIFVVNIFPPEEFRPRGMFVPANLPRGPPNLS